MSDFMREEFETWAMSNAFLGLSESCMERYKEGYLSCELHAAWEAWQASRECLVIELPADAHLSRDGLDEHYLAGDMRDQIVESIHASGVKTK